jgi:hypothetical protein
MLTRRRILAASVGVLAVVGVPRRSHAEQAPELQENLQEKLQESLQVGLEESELIYVTPIRSNGALSRCQAEVWFVHHESALYVVTAADAWRARAISGGLTGARIWVGDVGAWGDSKGAYRQLPQIDAVASQITDGQAQTEVLAAMGDKYSLEWLVWGRRFRNGLADGSRVMLRYGRPQLGRLQSGLSVPAIS